MPFTLRVINTNSGSILKEETYDTEEEAEDARQEWADGMSAGADTLELAGESYIDPDDLEYDIVEE